MGGFDSGKDACPHFPRLLVTSSAHMSEVENDEVSQALEGAEGAPSVHKSLTPAGIFKGLPLLTRCSF